MTAAAEGATYVPDGDPCPRHGQPTRLLRGAAGLFSQCDGCIADFFAWWSAHTRDIRPQATSSIPDEKRKPPQFELGVGV